MTFPWTTEQVLALTDDASSLKAARQLASGGRWSNVGLNAEAAWGECQGSGQSPYQVAVDFQGPAFKCTCPSRKFPCKHSLGLCLMLAGAKAPPGPTVLPVWASEWLEKRQQKRAAPARRPADEQIAAANDAPPEGEERQAQTRRDRRVAQGVDALTRWLEDLARRGWAASRMQPDGFFEDMAARLVDAQAPGLARRVRALQERTSHDLDHQEPVLRQIGLLQLALDGYARLNSLPAENQADIRAVFGFTMRQEAILQGEGVFDRWLIAGASHEVEYTGAIGRSAPILVQRTWLYGLQRQAWALLLDFSVAGQPLPVRPPVGTRLDATLVYYPGAFPLRALFKGSAQAAAHQNELPGLPDFEQARRFFAGALARNPWLDRLPAGLLQVRLAMANDAAGIVDCGGAWMPLSPAFEHYWQLMAISGGYPMDLMGEWDGDTFLPLTAKDGEQLYRLGRRENVRSS